MKLFQIFIISATLLLTPFACLAVQTSTWDFRNAQIPGSWNVTASTTATRTADGLQIETKNEGKMVRPYDIASPVDVVSLTFGSSRPIEGILFWHRKGAKQEFRLPFSVTGKDPPETIDIPLYHYSEWSSVDYIGVGFPAGAHVLLQKIEFSHWNVGEKLAEAWKTFWTFDGMKPYSINFLWGPMLTFTTPERVALLQNLPPRSWSALRVFYAILLIIGILCLCSWFLVPHSWFGNHQSEIRNSELGTRNNMQPLRIFIIVFAALWLLFDLRMGLEFLSYAATDYRTYIGRPAGTRTFRSLGRFHDVVLQSLPEIEKYPRFAFLGPDPGFTPFLRYFTYPSLPLSVGESMQGVNTWLIFERPDITVDAQGRLLIDRAQALAMSGAVLQQYEPGTFLYRTIP